MSNSIRKSLLTAGLGLAMSGVVVFSSVAAVPGLVTLSGHVPAVVSQLSAKGRLPAATSLNLALGLPLRNREALTNLLQQLYDPASTNYHCYLSPEQFTAQFGPTEQDYQAVKNFAAANGLTVAGTHPNRMLLNVSGNVSSIESAFHTTLRTYAHPAEARDFFAPDVEPSVPSALPVQDISGLDSYRRPHAKSKFKPAIAAANSLPNNASPKVGSGPFGLYMGDDFRTAYVPGTSLNGAGQTIALVQFDGYLASDIHAYENLTGRANIPLQNVLIDGFNGAPTGTGGQDEVSLDIEMTISMAPALSKVILYEGNPFNFHPNNVLNRIATDNSARQVSCSWGWTGGPNATTDQIFQQMAVQGQTFFNASGDADAFPASGRGSVDDPFSFGAPSSSPFITQVGGTTLTMGGSGAAYASETVWNWDVRYGPNYDGQGSSGGISSFYSIPSWQTNINMAARQGSTTKRNIPDVALTADDVLVIADGGIQYAFGGTSCAAPLWAGFTALVNQQATNSGRASVGFINPALYTIAAGTNYAACFHDITTGNNRWSGSPNLFNAVPGYDLCTGLGTPNGTNLINAMVNTTVVGPTHLSPPPPPYGSTLSALNGGNPNGTWALFVQDDAVFDDGIISNGWVLTLTTANPVGFAADLALSMTAAPGTVLVGSNVVYLIGVTNYGPSASSNAIVSDTLPSSVSLVSSNSTQGSVTRSGTLVVWNIGTLATNAGAQLTLVVRANSAGSIENSAIVNADTPDPNPDDNFALATVIVGFPTPPQISGTFVSINGTFQFSLTGTPGQTNIIQASTNLVNWIPIYTNVNPFLFTDPYASNYPVRFYRALLVP